MVNEDSFSLSQFEWVLRREFAFAFAFPQFEQAITGILSSVPWHGDRRGMARVGAGRGVTLGREDGRADRGGWPCSRSEQHLCHLCLPSDLCRVKYGLKDGLENSMNTHWIQNRHETSHNEIFHFSHPAAGGEWTVIVQDLTPCSSTAGGEWAVIV